MTLNIQVVDDTASCIFQGKIEVPEEVPYPPNAQIGGAISLVGLKTAIDYALYEADKKITS